MREIYLITYDPRLTTVSNSADNSRIKILKTVVLSSCFVYLYCI